MKWFCCFTVICFVACSDRQRVNPFDSKAIDAHGSPTTLVCIAGDGYVSLEWNLTAYDDIEGYKLLRLNGSGSEWQILNDPVLAPETTNFRDEQVENGETYEYRLAIIVEDEGEQLLGEVHLATPGPEIIWLADKGTGFVWKISPDGRSGHFARGQFSEINDIGVNVLDGSCWFVDGLSSSIIRIDIEGRVQSFTTDLGEVVDIEIDGVAGLGWVADITQQRVFSFDLSMQDSLELVAVDANFDQPVGLAGYAGSCWIVDRLQGRILRYSADRRKVLEFGGLDRPMAISVDSFGDSWVLTDEGHKIIKLKSDGSDKLYNLSIIDAIGLSVDVVEEVIWLFSNKTLAKLTTNGELLREWVDLPQLRSIAVDRRSKVVWVAMGQRLWKIDESDQILSRLSGFSSLGQIVVSSR
ncbi:MAG: hypothetical protein VX294_08160 [Candidatus Latescibacterota bacterium]|nr:hypothetical protein [Candidatus Latescibacterota bacterium]